MAQRFSPHLFVHLIRAVFTLYENYIIAPQAYVVSIKKIKFSIEIKLSSIVSNFTYFNDKVR